MKCVTFDGLGEYVFYDVRYDGRRTQATIRSTIRVSRARDPALRRRISAAAVSREHAPQAIYRAGFRAVIAQSFAEIFFGNCTLWAFPVSPPPRRTSKRSPPRSKPIPV